MNNNYYAKLAKNKSLLKEYKTSFCDRTVYLNDGDEFQFQLFNPETEEISVRIFIESSQLSHDIVLRPGERIWLERYTDNPKKFRFNTYYVNGNNKEVQHAIADNGEIKIQFYHKKKKEPIWINSPSVTWTYLNNTSTGGFELYNNFIYSDAPNAADAINTVTTSFGTINAQNLNSSNSSISLSSCDSILYSTPDYSFAATNVEENTKLETGRVCEGGYSKQKFSNVNMDFEYFSFRTEVIKILPESRKPYNVKDLKKMYCSNCGRKLNVKYKYCPYCGEKIN